MNPQSKADLNKRLERAYKRWNQARGMYLETRLSCWDEEISLASKEIDYVSNQIDLLNEASAIAAE